MNNFEIKKINNIDYLLKGNKTLMSSTMSLKEDYIPVIEKCSGKVLLSGLGLGIILEELVKKEDITKIIVVEKYQEVIDLVWDNINTNKAEIICDDIFNYLDDIKEEFDWMYFDVWEDKSVKTHLDIVAPLRKKAQKYLPYSKILCWGF
jgi:hypothetical protein